MATDAKALFEDLYPAALLREEAGAVDARRRAPVPPDASDRHFTELPPDTVGLALSGGGIRSATFCLGVVQALAKLKILGKIDYLSTVSGGGYFGSFLGGWINRLRLDQQKAAAAGKVAGGAGNSSLQSVEESLHDDLSPEIKWLRENGRYLMPNGSGDALLAAAVGIRNLVSIHLVLGWFVLSLFLIAHCGAAHYLRLICHKFPYWRSIPHPQFLDQGFALEADGPDQLWTLTSPGSEVHVQVVNDAGSWLQHFQVYLSPWLLLPVIGLIVALLLGLSFWIYEMVKPDNESNFLSRALALALGLTGGSFVFACVDTVGRSLASHPFTFAHGQELAGLIAGLTALGGAVRSVAAPLAKLVHGQGKFSLPLGVLAGLAASIMIVIWLCAWNYLAYRIPPFAANLWPALSGYLWILGFIMLFLAWLFSQASRLWKDMKFLNLSSIATLYSARLTRAYLGASNRFRQISHKYNVTETIPGDEIPFAQYFPHLGGGPLHLINVTINETVLGRSQTVQRDRKGISMCVGPAGLTVSSTTHALWENKTKANDPLSERTGWVTPLPPVKSRLNLLDSGEKPQAPHKIEMLSLGEWAGVSGAAVGTGQGAHTSLGLSLLFGFFNVRLGWWWNSHVDPAKQKDRAKVSVSGKIYQRLGDMFPTQVYLLNEFLARFPGPNEQHWYLSDGGHFENTGAYELLRRRLPFIIISDNGCDPGRVFDDFANLVRKARLDFNLEIKVVDPKKDGCGVPLIGPGIPTKENTYLGTLDQLREKIKVDDHKSPYYKQFAFVATATHNDQLVSTILVIKPTIIEGLPEDVINYHVSNPTFPQESTADQFFNEAQWESYRKLGYCLTEKLFAQAASVTPLRKAFYVPP
jgi:hypothetical protein